jgi:hypothetical protein
MKHTNSDPADVILRFFRSLDDQAHDRIPNLFCDDGVWHRRDLAHKGPDEVRRSLADIPPVMPTVHLVTNLQMDQSSANEARAVFYVTALRPSAAVDITSTPWGMELPLVVTLYKADLKMVAGEWRIKAIRNDPIFRR